MDYTSIFPLMRAELTLMAILVIVFLYDLIAGERGRRWFSAVTCVLLLVQVAELLGDDGPAGLAEAQTQFLIQHNLTTFYGN